MDPSSSLMELPINEKRERETDRNVCLMDMTIKGCISFSWNTDSEVFPLSFWRYIAVLFFFENLHTCVCVCVLAPSLYLLGEIDPSLIVLLNDTSGLALVLINFGRKREAPMRLVICC